jgi:outer membrane lipase/esterase
MAVWAKTARLALAAGVALAAMGGAMAQTRYITFGDSLSDIGNLFAAVGQPPSPYFQGRFSNGQVWIELIAGNQAKFTGGLTPAGSVNFAFGGARTDALVALPPGTGTQIGAFFAGGGTIGANDVVTLWAGANNLLQAIAIPANQSPTAMGAVATTTATDVITQVAQLAAAGARTIVVPNLPDLGFAPAFNTSPASPLASFAQFTYNSTLAAGLQNIAAANPNTRILQVNIGGLFQAVLANPGAFGFSNVTNQCLTTISCVTAPQATQNSYLFWDGVHPTAAGHAIVAQVVTQYLNAGDRATAVAAISEISVSDRRLAAGRALDRVADYKPRAGTTDIYVSLIGDRTETGRRGSVPGYAVSAGGLELGILRHLSAQTTIGVALSAKTGEASTSALGNKVDMTPTTFAADITARWAAGNGLFIQGGLGASVTRITEFERSLGIANFKNKGEATAHAFSAIAKVGYDLGMGALTLTPAARLGVISGTMNDFRESGVVAPLAYSGRTVSTFLAAAELTARVKLSDTVSAHAMVGYEAYFGQTGTTLRGSIADSPGSGFSRAVGKVESPGFLFGAGLTGMIGAMQATAEYRGSVSSDGKAQHRGTLSARIGF